MPADPAQTLITGSGAPFACAATKGGVYVDTTCAQVCVCVTADAKWARSDTGVEGTATDCCPPPTTTTTTTTTSTTSTTLAAAAPSWVSAMLAAWMLDETSGTRADAGGTAARDLSVVSGTDPASSTDHMEGTRSMSLASAQARSTTDIFPTLVSPLSTGCWVKAAAGTVSFLMHDATIAAGTFLLQRGTSVAGFQWRVQDSGNAAHQITAGSSWPSATWAHVVGTMLAGGTVKLYVDGLVRNSAAMGTAVARNQAFFVGDNSTFNGLVDECFLANLELTATAICRICSCGLRGEQCTCSGTAFATTGRNATACNSCTLPADCSASTPS